MKNVKQLIELFGGLDKLKKAAVEGGDYIRIENEPFMRLVIEWIGPGTSTYTEQISVAHYYEQNGDAMRDPEITFEVERDTLEMTPLTFQQDNMGIYWELTTPAKLADAEEFCKMWDENIRDQGFLESFKNLSLQQA